MPGMGGSQRLTRLIRQAKAMEMCLTGRLMDATEASGRGWWPVSFRRICCCKEAMANATAIAEMSLPAMLAIKDAIRRAPDVALADRRLL